MPDMTSDTRSDHRRSACHIEDHAGDPRGPVGCEEDGGVCYVLGRAESLERVKIGQGRLLGGGDALPVAGGEDRLRPPAVRDR
jgi:hypothetical protein